MVRLPYLLESQAAGGEYSIPIIQLILLLRHLVLQVTVKSMDNITSTMSRSFQEVRAFEIVYLNL